MTDDNLQQAPSPSQDTNTGITEEEQAALHSPLTIPSDSSGASSNVTAIPPDGRDGPAGSPFEAWYTLGTGLLYLIIFRASTFLPERVSSMVFVTLTVLVILLVFTARLARSIRTSAQLLVNSLLATLFAGPRVLFPILFARFPTWAGWPQIGPIYASYVRLIGHVLGLKELLLIWLAVCIGVGISRMIREFKLLLPIAVVLALVDLFTVFGGGVVQQAVNGSSPLAAKAMSALTVQLPQTSVTQGSAPIQLLIGFADFLFIALFFACFRRFGIAAWGTFIALATFLTLYMVVVAYTGIALPALVPIAVVIITMNLRYFRYDRSEIVALAVAGGLVAAITGALYWVGHH